MKAEVKQGLSGERSSPRGRRSCELPNANHTWENHRRSDVAFKVPATWVLKNQRLRLTNIPPSECVSRGKNGRCSKLCR